MVCCLNFIMTPVLHSVLFLHFRGRGAVIVMASSAADTPAAEIAVYGATKVKFKQV